MSQIAHGFTMPMTAPIVASMPARYVGNRTIGVTFRTKQKVLDALVPKPLVPNAQGQVGFYIGCFNLVGLPYLEAGIQVPVTLFDAAGIYFVYLYLDKVVPIVAGREIFGFPKKDAEITFVEQQDRIQATVVRGGVQLVSVALDLGEPLPISGDEPALAWYNLKLIPSVVRGAPPEVMQIATCSHQSETKALRAGKAQLDLLSGPQDPLGDIPVLEILGAQFSVADMVLDLGEVVYNYLAAG
jgi:acetoacetate decarboxylase